MTDPELAERQFSIEGYVFGHGRRIFVDATGFDPGDPDVETQDVVDRRTGARRMGRDTLSGPTWTWALHVDHEEEEAALAELANLGAVWRDEALREPGAFTSVRYRVAGRVRRVFGRPRRLSYSVDNRLSGGYLPPLATFDVADARHYDDVESEVEIRLAPTVDGGFAAPFAAPITLDLGEEGGQPGLVDVGGDTSTPLVVEFEGPATNPKVKIGDVVVGLRGTLNAGGRVIVDARPWAMTVQRVGVTTEVTLSRETRLAKALVGPGQRQALYTGIDYTGLSRCRVRWRDAHTTL